MKFHVGQSKDGAGSIAAKMKTIVALATVSLALFLVPGQAFAAEDCANASADPVQGKYCAPVQQIQAGLGAGGGQPAERVAVPTADNGPSLPFTGLDVAALAAVALALTGTGVVLRRLATMGDAQK